MKWASAISTAPTLGAAVDEALGRVSAQLDHDAPDLALVFISTGHAGEHSTLARLIAAEWSEALLFGCAATGVIGAGREVQDTPAVSITAAVLPGVELTPIRLEQSTVPPTFAERVAWESALGVQHASAPQFLVIADPFSFDAENLGYGLDRAFPQSIKIGGLASGARQPGGNLLLLGQHAYRSGAIVLALSGDVRIDPVVAQGCRPIGEPMFVTSCHGNLLRELDGRMPRDVLTELFEKLNPRDQQLVANSLFIGLALPGTRPDIQAGEFLIRNVLGLDPETGMIGVAAQPELNSVVQFQVRDAVSSAQDLERRLRHYASRRTIPPAGALLFSCVGRGTGLYGSPDHDSNLLKRHLGELPIGGFFCSGEIGPVQGATQVHGYTSAVALIGPK